MDLDCDGRGQQDWILGGRLNWGAQEKWGVVLDDQGKGDVEG